MFDKPIEKLTLQDIESLVQNQVPENRGLDYKQEYKFSRDTDKKEFLADICSFANSGGGYLIYGISEHRENNQGTGYPEEIIGLENFNSDHERNRFEPAIQQGIQPRVYGIESKLIEHNGNDPILVIKIPRSYNTPHMVTFKGANKFYSRNSAGKYPINDIEEIRDFFLKADSLPKSMRNFRLDRLSAIKNGDTSSPIGSGRPCFVLHIFPMDSFSSGHKILDIKQISTNCLEPISYSIEHSQCQINYDGLCVFSQSRPYDAQTQIYRDGKIEIVTSNFIKSEETSKTIESDYEDELVKYVKHYIEKLESWEIKGPFYVYISLLNIRGFKVIAYNIDHGESIENDDLLLPEIEFSDKNQVSHEKFRHSFDLVWNASGRWGSPNFDSDGNWQRAREF